MRHGKGNVHSPGATEIVRIADTIIVGVATGATGKAEQGMSGLI
jgi:hypothetical protein